MEEGRKRGRKGFLSRCFPAFGYDIFILSGMEGVFEKKIVMGIYGI